MKIFYSLCLCLCVGFSAIAQERYIDDVFTDVTVTSDVTYGTNATILFLPQVGELIPQDLKMDIYEPAGDTETARPVVLVFHTGNFLPNVTNGQIAGTKEDNSSVEICTRLAKKGYVAASVTYRQGWNPLAQTQPERALGLIQAAYRGVQDGRNAIRFMKTEAATYGIDENKVAVWGNGTGGYLTLGLVGLSDYLEIVQTTNTPGKFLLDLDGDGTPETPMVVPTYHGDINGEVLTIAPDAAFGFPAGDTSNYVNYAGVSNEFALGINIGGDLGDISWLNDNTTPTISVQSAFDQFAPYNDGVLVVPTTGDPIVQVQGAQQIGAAQDAAGNNDLWKDIDWSNDAATQTAIANSVTAGHPYYEGVYPWVKDPNSLGIDEGVVIDWWNEDDASPANGAGMGIPWNQLPHPSGGTFHEQGLVLNENMSAEKANANIDDIFAYVIPRACIALDLGCSTVAVEEVLEDQSFITASPNPASDVITITSADQTMESIRLYNMNGGIVQYAQNVNTNTYAINRNGLPAGIYFAKIKFEQGIATQKVVFK